MAIFPLAPDQTIAQMWSNGVRGGLDSSLISGDTAETHMETTHFISAHQILDLIEDFVNTRSNLTVQPTSGLY